MKLMKKLIFLPFFFNFLFFSFVFAGTGNNVSGWAWSDNVGWFSFNCYNDYNGDGVLEDNCASSNYGVNVGTTTGKLSGYAWSDNLGWISFNRSETNDPPPVYDPCPDGSCIAKIDNLSKIGSSDVYVFGWARALSACPSETGNDPSDPFDDPCQSTNENVGGWTGWIRFDYGSLNEIYENGEVYIDQNGDFHGFAWSDNPNVGPLGWISFNCQEGGPGATDICSTSSYKVFLDLASFNQKPIVTPTGVTWDNCCFKKISIPTFHWNYSDPDGDPMAGYEIKIYGETDTFFASSTGVSFEYTLQDTTWIENNLLFGKTYSWEIRVVDNRGAWSDWVSTNFTTPSHPHPWVSFNWYPQRPSVGEAVQFCSIFESGVCENQPADGWSECYDLAGNATPCSFWQWDFDIFATPQFSTDPNPTTTFSSIASSTIILTITDSYGASCSSTVQIRPTFPLPKWKEIGPTTFLREKSLVLFC
jgi:hypothetical protein